MKIYRFTVFFRNVDYMTEDMAEALYRAGCDDCTPASSGGQAYAHFARQADSLETAVASAADDVRSAGCAVERVEIIEEDIVANAAT